MTLRKNNRGFSLVELLLTLAIGSALMTGLGALTHQALQARDISQQQARVNQAASFAMNRIIDLASRSPKMLTPSTDNPTTSWSESIRQHPAPSESPGGSAVLVLLIDPTVDLDGDGAVDADNDKDGKVDEDPGGDSNNDQAPGAFAIDDDNDGNVDEQHTKSFGGNPLGPTNEDDDEDDYANEDLIDGIDTDGDGKFDEDIKKQLDGDDLPGIGGVDDDGDGSIDEGDKNDDDEDGNIDEDWYDTLVVYLDGATLKERYPVPWDANNDGGIDGKDVIESDLLENVLELRFERKQTSSSQVDLLAIDMVVEDPQTQQPYHINSQVRIGGAL